MSQTGCSTYGPGHQLSYTALIYDSVFYTLLLPRTPSSILFLESRPLFHRLYLDVDLIGCLHALNRRHLQHPYSASGRPVATCPVARLHACSRCCYCPCYFSILNITTLSYFHSLLGPQTGAWQTAGGMTPVHYGRQSMLWLPPKQR